MSSLWVARFYGQHRRRARRRAPKYGEIGEPQTTGNFCQELSPRHVSRSFWEDIPHPMESLKPFIGGMRWRQRLKDCRIDCHRWDVSVNSNGRNSVQREIGRNTAGTIKNYRGGRAGLRACPANLAVPRLRRQALLRVAEQGAL